MSRRWAKNPRATNMLTIVKTTITQDQIQEIQNPRLYIEQFSIWFSSSSEVESPEELDGNTTTTSVLSSLLYPGTYKVHTLAEVLDPPVQL